MKWFFGEAEMHLCKKVVCDGTNVVYGTYLLHIGAEVVERMSKS